LVALAAAGGILLLTLAGCGMAGRAEPPSAQVAAAQGAAREQADAGDSAEVSGDQEQRRTPTPTPRPRRTPAATPTRAPPARIDGLPVIYVDQLPREARTTLRLIEEDGPFPYSKDGSVFQNREGILPQRPRGYYREYTVITPGENDRGARRIVGGARGEMYYTDDHYDSFSRIMER
jgi:guanyl-specific ribonuclease Sa